MVRCQECGKQAGPDVQAHGWRAYLDDDPEDDHPPAVVVYCARCAEREFGEDEPD